ncbi:hypothetical protein BOX15_Mlig005009g1, partial [Macrostomum lignano]
TFVLSTPSMFVWRLCSLIHKRKLLVEEERRLNRVSQDPIAIEQFVNEFRRRCKAKELQYEFKAIELISVGDKQSTKIRSEGKHKIALAAKRACNRAKNLTERVLPYERNIVHLDQYLDQPAADPGNDAAACSHGNEPYINASWIDGYKHPKKFIAAQGPLSATKADFWQMVWQYQVQCIVMTTNLFEHARQQCDKYWHNVHARFNSLDVWLDELYSTAEYEMRLFRLQMGEDSSQARIIRQFQFKNWSHFDTPLPTTVVEIRRKVNDWMRGKDAPIVVHCSDGAGRTGTYICIDIEISKVENGKPVDILQQTLALRKARSGLVGNMHQYRFIYETICSFITCRPTTIKAFEFAQLVERMSSDAAAASSTNAAIISAKKKAAKFTQNGFQLEFANLTAIVKSLSVGECAGGHRAENRWKSRDVMVQPPERARPYLLTHDCASSTDFINAVYIDGHTRSNQYIVTQWPLRNTICDFWKLVNDHHVAVVVLLVDYSNSSRSYPRFWPNARNEETGYGSVYVILQDQFSVGTSIRVRMHTVAKQAGSCSTGLSQRARHVAFLCLDGASWPAGARAPASGHGLLELVCLAEETNQAMECTSPILVVSSNGVSRCGPFCVLHMTMDKLRFEGEIDIFRAVEKVKRNRPQLVENSTEYELCFNLTRQALGYFYSGRLQILPDQSLWLQLEGESGGVQLGLEGGLPSQVVRPRVRAARPATLDDFRFPVTSRRNRRRRRRRAADLEGTAAASGEAAAGVEIETETAAMV